MINENIFINGKHVKECHPPIARNKKLIEYIKYYNQPNSIFYLFTLPFLSGKSLTNNLKPHLRASLLVLV